MIPTTTHTPAFAAVLAGRVVPCSPDGAGLELAGAERRPRDEVHRLGI